MGDGHGANDPIELARRYGALAIAALAREHRVLRGAAARAPEHPRSIRRPRLYADAAGQRPALDDIVALRGAPGPFGVVALELDSERRLRRGPARLQSHEAHRADHDVVNALGRSAGEVRERLGREIGREPRRLPLPTRGMNLGVEGIEKVFEQHPREIRVGEAEPLERLLHVGARRRRRVGALRRGVASAPVLLPGGGSGLDDEVRDHRDQERNADEGVFEADAEQEEDQLCAAPSASAAAARSAARSAGAARAAEGPASAGASVGDRGGADQGEREGGRDREATSVVHEVWTSSGSSLTSSSARGSEGASSGPRSRSAARKASTSAPRRSEASSAATAFS